MLRRGPAVARAAWLVAVALLVFTFAQLAFPQQKTPSQVDSLYRQGLAAVKRGDLAHARGFFEEMIKLAPGSPEAHNSLGWVFFSQGHTPEAISQLRIALKLKPNFLQAHVNLANALAQNGNLPQADSEARELVRLAPQNAEAHRTLGRVA